MPTPIDWPRWNRYKKEIESCLREGYTRPNETGGRGSAVEEAHRRLRDSGYIISKSRNVLQGWVRAQIRLASRGHKNACPDWNLYKTTEAVRIDCTSRVVERAIFTSAQNDTAIHRPFFDNLKALCVYYGARLHIGRFSYQTGVRLSRTGKRTVADMQWHPDLVEYLTSERFGIGSDILFCAEMNTLPTAARPLSGLYTYGQGKTAIFPHAKVALETVPTSSDTPPVCVLTTGACTVPNYTDSKAGYKGAFHHVLGAVIVEVDDEGNTFFRHIIAQHDGSFQDLEFIVKNGTVLPGNRVEAITFGDCHVPYLDPNVALGTWDFNTEIWSKSSSSSSNMIDILRPSFGIVHDLIDFRSINHHENKKPRMRYRTFIEGNHLVGRDLTKAAQFLKAINRDFMKTIVIESNHGRWLERWLDEVDHRKDRDNALIFLRLEQARMLAEASGDKEFNVLNFALQEASISPTYNLFVPDGGSFKICHDTGGIECGAHGHLGINGSKGSPAEFLKIGEKMTIGDKHSPGIYDGLYIAGVSCLSRMGYNLGPSGWAHAHVITYHNGKRTLVFFKGSRWRA